MVLRYIEFISMLMARSRNDNYPYHENQNRSLWYIKSNIKKLKFDLVNIIDDKLIILELKNRVDSGGTAARGEALSKKFLNICRTIESGEKIFVYQGRDRDFVEMLSILGINKVEMNLGFLFNINGKEARIEGDRLHGFYSSSKTHMKNYLNELDHNIADLLFEDENRLSLSFRKQSLSVSINMLYGNEVIQKFSGGKYGISKLMERFLLLYGMISGLY